MELDNVFVKEDVQKVPLEYQGKTIDISIRGISWSKKNQILTKCFTYDQSGQMKFDFDKYMKEMLVEIIVEAPWGKTDQIFLNKIKPDFGTLLEKLVPKAFEEMSNVDFFVKESEA